MKLKAGTHLFGREALDIGVRSLCTAASVGATKVVRVPLGVHFRFDVLLQALLAVRLVVGTAVGHVNEYAFVPTTNCTFPRGVGLGQKRRGLCWRILFA